MSQRSHGIVLAAGALAAGALALAFLGAVGALPVPSAAEAAETTSAYALRHTAYAPAALATARVTVLHMGVYRLRILATHLLAPETLRVAPQRHVYLAWAFDGKDPGGALRAAPLVFHRSTGAYSADGIVRITHITELFITADKASGREAPTIPEVSVLSTVGHLQLS